MVGPNARSMITMKIKYLSTGESECWKYDNHEDQIPKRFLHHSMIFSRSENNDNNMN